MKLTKVKILVSLLALALLISISVFLIIGSQNYVIASADASNGEDSAETDEAEKTIEYFISENVTNVDATYSFVKINESECSVKIKNKADATVAILPNKGIIDGKEYKVTAIATNGFASSPKLERVRLSANIKKINNSAFSNCAELKIVDLNKVETIGNNVFYKCTNLKNIRIPETVTSVGSNVFRNNTTYVHIVGDEGYVAENWTSTWNSNNNCVEGVDYNSKYLDLVPLDKIYSEDTRSADNEPVGYAYATGQPINFSYSKIQTYSNEVIENGDVEDYRVGGNIIIPAATKEDNIPILKIADYAFCDVQFDKCIIKHSDNPIEICSSAFYGARGCEIIINRDIEFVSDSEDECSEIFSCSQIESIVLPDTLTELPKSIFASCENLRNIFFKAPKSNLTENELLNLVDTLKNSENEGKVELPSNETFNTIGESAFEQVNGIQKLTIESNVQNMGACVFEGWDNDNQYVYIKNNTSIPEYKLNDDGSFTGWHEQWNGSFTHFEMEKTFYTVKFILGDRNTSRPIEKGHTLGKLPEAENGEFIFDGWYSGDKKYDENTIITSNIELKARWKKLVTLDYQNEDGGKDEIYVYFNEELPKCDVNGNDLVAPIKLGYSFKGYYTEPNDSVNKGELYYVGSTLNNKLALEKTIYDDETVTKLYAHWEIETYKIDYKLLPSTGFNGSLEDISLKSYTIEDTKKGDLYFEFIVNGNYKISYTPRYIEENSAEDIQVYCKWVNRVTTISYNLLGGSNSVDNPSSIGKDETKVLYPATKVGYEFSGWYLNGNLITEVSEMYEESITLFAQWSDRVTNKHIKLNSSDTYVTIENRADVTFILPSGGFYETCEIYIPTEVKNLHIYAETYRAYNMYIHIITQSSINLYLENFELVAPEMHVGIRVNAMRTNNYSMKLYTYGTVIIHGGNGADGTSINNDAQDGAAAVSCSAVSICHADNLSIIGGNSGQPYYSGAKYGNGGYAIDANEIKIFTANVNNLRSFGGNSINYTVPPYPTTATVKYI